MSNTRLTAAAGLVGGLAMLASGVLAQDQKAERREKLRKLGEAAAAIAADRIEAAKAAEADVVAGHVIILGKPAAEAKAAEAKEVNNGGLVVVRVPDSQGRPPQDIHVDAGPQFQRLGEVRGITQKDGKPQPAGGYTWILLKPVAEGAVTIAVAFTPNGAAAAVKREFKVNVTPAAVENTGG